VNVDLIVTLNKTLQWYIERLASGTYIIQNQLYGKNYASYTPFDVASDKATVSSVWTLKPMQWRIDPSDREGSYLYVLLQALPLLLFITIMIRISDLSQRRYWNISSAYLKVPVSPLSLMSVESKAEA
jgi:hypothetical protein